MSAPAARKRGWRGDTPTRSLARSLNFLVTVFFALSPSARRRTQEIDVFFTFFPLSTVFLPLPLPLPSLLPPPSPLPLPSLTSAQHTPSALARDFLRQRSNRKKGSSPIFCNTFAAFARAHIKSCGQLLYLFIGLRASSLSLPSFATGLFFLILSSQELASADERRQPGKSQVGDLMVFVLTQALEISPLRLEFSSRASGRALLKPFQSTGFAVRRESADLSPGADRHPRTQADTFTCAHLHADTGPITRAADANQRSRRSRARQFAACGQVRRRANG